MKTVRRFRLALLLLIVVGCSDEGLVGVAVHDEPLAVETALPLLPRIGAVEREMLLEMETDAANAGDAMVRFVGEGRFAEVPDRGTVRCVDADGNRVPGLFLFARSTVEGRFFYFDDMTGVFARDRCVLGVGELFIEGRWRFTGGHEGEAIWGPYTATVSLADGSFTHKEIITNGTGRFAQATGWIRGTGTMPPGGGDSMFYGYGLITRPREVSSRGFVMQAASVSQEGSILCVDERGEPAPIDAPAQFNIEGLATYLGRTSGVLANERCEADFRGFPILSGSWTFTGAQGDVLQGTYTALFPQTPRIRIEMVITGGTGPFENASGWVNGVASLRPDGFDLPLEGLIFLPR